MPSRGQSVSMSNTRKASLKAFELFRTCDPAITAMLPRPWGDLTAEELCTMDVWARFATYLHDTHKKDNGEYLATGTVIDYLGAALNMASDRFKATGSGDINAAPGAHSSAGSAP